MNRDVVIIEDDKSLQGMMANALESAGFCPHAAALGAAGFEIALLRRPRLVVTDIRLPDLSGFELCRRIKGHPELAGTLVLMVTGTYTRDEDKERGASLGADAYLLKPFHMADFLKLVRDLAGDGPTGPPGGR